MINSVELMVLCWQTKLITECKPSWPRRRKKLLILTEALGYTPALYHTTGKVSWNQSVFVKFTWPIALPTRWRTHFNASYYVGSYYKHHGNKIETDEAAQHVVSFHAGQPTFDRPKVFTSLFTYNESRQSRSSRNEHTKIFHAYIYVAVSAFYFARKQSHCNAFMSTMHQQPQYPLRECGSLPPPPLPFPRPQQQPRWTCRRQNDARRGSPRVAGGAPRKTTARTKASQYCWAK